MICDIRKSDDRNIPDSVGYRRIGKDSMRTAWGIAVSGVQIFTAISGEGVDPFYPAAYGKVTNPDEVVERVDQCLAHPMAAGIFHYHIPSPCIPDPSIAE